MSAWGWAVGLLTAANKNSHGSQVYDELDCAGRQWKKGLSVKLSEWQCDGMAMRQLKTPTEVQCDAGRTRPKSFMGRIQ